MSACVFATPIGSVEQAVGRIQRPCATKRTPVECIDVVDTFSIFSHMARKRRKLYQAHKFCIVDSDARAATGSEVVPQSIGVGHSGHEKE